MKNVTLIVGGQRTYTRKTSRPYKWAVIRWAFRKASSKQACLGISNLSNDEDAAYRAADEGSRWSNVATAFQPGAERPFVVRPVNEDGTVVISSETAAVLLANAITT